MTIKNSAGISESAKITVAVAGGSGYAGGELLRLILAHPRLELKTVTGDSSAGQRLGALQPHLHALADYEILPTTVENLSGHDVLFLALPHGASAPLIQALHQKQAHQKTEEPANKTTKTPLIIDLGADYRLESAEAWDEFYSSQSKPLAHPGSWPYGLPELQRQNLNTEVSDSRHLLANARKIAVPGCYPTSVLLALAPGLAASVISGEDVVVVSASGTSGAGKSSAPHLLGSEVMGSMTPYGVGGIHRHTPEMEQGLSHVAGIPVRVSFTPTLAPMPRGILTTATAKRAPGITSEQVRAAWEKAYDAEPFVRLLPQGQWPKVSSVLGSNMVHLQVAVDERSGRVIVSAAIDNLTKGTAGGAIQSMNLALGIEETMGLNGSAVAP